MAVGGTVSTPVFVKDGQYLSLTADATITIGNVIKFTTTSTDTCDVGSAASGSPTIVGVAVGGDRFSRTQTANTIATGAKVTVCTRGIVRVYTGTSAILKGSFLEAGAAGIVELTGTSGTADSAQDIIGVALDANGSAATTIRMALMRF
jgi:hypothetical protein